MKLSLLGVGLLALSSTIGFSQAAPPAAPTHAYAPHHATVNLRRAMQQHRIAQGARTGRLTVRQANRLERREVRIGRAETHMRAANGGRLTRADRIVLNHRLNRTSRAIYRDKHHATRQ
jgi:hypothetical protein